MKKQILELTNQLISIESTQGNRDAMEKVLSIVKGRTKGYSVTEFSSNNSPSLLISNTESASKKFKLILNAHVDVVPGDKGLFIPKIKGNKLIGRGAYDMKAAAAVEILVFAELAKITKFPIALQIVTDEEVGGFDGVKYQMKHGITADFILAGEPTNFHINNIAKGIIWVKVKAFGKAAHGANLWQGNNAVWTMNSYLNTLKKKFPEPSKEVWKTTLNVGTIQTSNTTYNKVPEYCEAGLDIRYLPEEKEATLRYLKESLLKGMKLEIIMNEPCLNTPKLSPHIVKLSQAVESVTNTKASLIRMHFGSDARHFTNKKIDAVTFGPKGYGLHTDDEWVDIQSLEDYFYILKSFIQSYEN